jgi:hypothetical protein
VPLSSEQFLLWRSSVVVGDELAVSAGASDDINSQWNDQTNYTGQYPPDWDARRKSVYRRDDWTCTRCGTKSGPHAGRRGVRLHAHHRTPLDDGGSNHLSNLTTLCESCHNQAHEHDITAGLPRRGRGVSGWFWRLVGYLFGSVTCLVIHAVGLFVLVSVPVGTLVWLASVGYLALLAGLVSVRPHWIAILYGLAGGLGLVLVQSTSQSILGMTSPLAIVGVVYWVPAVLAGLVWVVRR